VQSRSPNKREGAGKTGARAAPAVSREPKVTEIVASGVVNFAPQHYKI
jgi:hypothetical protein